MIVATPDFFPAYNKNVAQPHMQTTVDHYVWFYCTITDPTSQQGRRVGVHMTEEQATDFLRELKYLLTRLRSGA